MFLLCLLFACENVQTSSENPEQQDVTSSATKDPSEKSTSEVNKLQKCVETCVKSRQMEARAIDSIQDDCEKGCKNQPLPLSPDDKR